MDRLKHCIGCNLTWPVGSGESAAVTALWLEVASEGTARQPFFTYSCHLAAPLCQSLPTPYGFWQTPRVSWHALINLKPIFTTALITKGKQIRPDFRQRYFPFPQRERLLTSLPIIYSSVISQLLTSPFLFHRDFNLISFHQNERLTLSRLRWFLTASDRRERTSTSTEKEPMYWNNV